MHTTDPNCIFCKIVRGEIPGKKVFEDADVLAFHDIRPLAPVHFMLVPKKHIASLYEVTMDDAPVLGKMLALARKLAKRTRRRGRIPDDHQYRARRKPGSPACPHPRDRRPGTPGPDDPADDVR